MYVVFLGDGREEGRINWYPWGVQIYGYELAVARVGPRVGRMLKKNAIEGNGMETRINAISVFELNKIRRGRKVDDGKKEVVDTVQGLLIL